MSILIEDTTVVVKRQYLDSELPGALYTCRYFVAEESRTVVCTTRCPVIIPEAARSRAMEFITRANSGSGPTSPCAMARSPRRW